MITALLIVAVVVFTIERDFYVSAEDYTLADKCANRMRLLEKCFWFSCIVVLVSLL